MPTFTPNQWLVLVERSSDDIDVLRAQLAHAEQEQRRMILAALRCGIPVTTVADAAGISRQRVYQIRDGK